jgi:hypothetical protein
MVIELLEIVGPGAVAATGGLLLRARRRGDGSRPELVQTPPENPAWRVLKGEEELRQALERAIACERAVVTLSEQRAERFDALRTQLVPKASPGPLRNAREPRQAPRQPGSRAS